jgi:DNA-binding MarR family transcriptional regulator
MGPAGATPYRFGDLLALARQSWVRQVTEQVELAGFSGYRRTDSWLLRLLRREAMPIGQIGIAMGVTRQAARKFADGLAERGYATLRADPADARRTLVELTPAGLAYADAVQSAQDSLNDAVRHRVSAPELAAADAVLRAVFPGQAARTRIAAAVPPPANETGA